MKDSNRLRASFEEFYDEWTRFLENPKLRYVSRSTDLLKSKAFLGIVSLGPAAIPLIVEKLPEQPLLHYALARITGIDFRRKFPEAFSERERAQLWISWWKKGEPVPTRQ
jgi:hypothetical protein